MWLVKLRNKKRETMNKINILKHITGGTMHNLKIDFQDYGTYTEYIQVLDILKCLGWKTYHHHFVNDSNNNVVEDYTMLVHDDTSDAIWSKTSKILDILRR